MHVFQASGRMRNEAEGIFAVVLYTSTQVMQANGQRWKLCRPIWNKRAAARSTVSAEFCMCVQNKYVGRESASVTINN